MSNSAITVTRSSLTGELPGDLAVMCCTVNGPGMASPTSWTMPAGAVVVNGGFHGVGTQILDAGSDIVMGENSSTGSASYYYAYHALIFRGLTSTPTVHKLTHSPTIITTEPTTIIAFSDGPITKAGSTSRRAHTTMGVYLYLNTWDLATPGLDTWSSTGTFYESIAVTGSVVAIGGRPKAYVGGSFQSKPGKVWTGSAWVEKPWKVWTGSTWKTLT